MVWRGCLVLDSYEKWYGEDVLFSIHMMSGMERMSFSIHMRSVMERMSYFRFIREVIWRGCLVLDSYDEWYGEDVLF